MLTVTDQAKALLHDLIDQNSIAEDQSIRLVARENGLGLAPDSARPTDEVYDHNGRTVLLVDKEIAQHLTDRTLGVSDTEQGPQLNLT